MPGSRVLALQTFGGLRAHTHTHGASHPGRPITPVMLDYKIQADDKSMYNTPPCWSIYIAGLVFAKMRADGGLAAALANNEKVGQ